MTEIEYANIIIIYAWLGIVFVLIPTTLALIALEHALKKASKALQIRLTAIYRLSCIWYYFKKMEKEGTHAFKKTHEGDL